MDAFLEDYRAGETSFDVLRASQSYGRADRCPADQRSPDQSSATRMESLGFAGSYLTLAG